MKKVELLAPAGNLESLYAAVQAGADAVYLGGNKFSARAYASNFDDKTMKEAVEYCHLYNVKVYVTINTIMKEKELKEACKYAEFLYNVGVDALIIQDIGLASLLREKLPELELHASTQMTVHNGEAALFLSKLGFKRIVLSRELSLKEIEYISKTLEIETEIFIHGALCICYSGQCLMSSMIGGRSGNRGRCAQPCRLPYEIVNKKEASKHKGYILSPKDMCTIEDIKEIIESGASSLKIEGRMKRPEYVAGVVSEYRNAIDNFYQDGKKLKDLSYIEGSKKRLLQLFNRQGFSKAYLYKNTGKDMMAYSFPKNTGIEIGKVNSDKGILLTEDISEGDGVRIGTSGFTISKLVKSRKETVRAYKGERVKIFPANYKAGDRVYKTSDLIQLQKLEKIYEDHYGKKINLCLKIQFEVGKPVTLYCNYDKNDFRVEGQIVEEALKQPLSKERIYKSLNKTGNNIFKFDSIEFEIFQLGFLPISDLNEIRRRLLDEIKQYILNKNKKSSISSKKVYEVPVLKNNFDKVYLPPKMVFVNTNEQLKAVMESSFEHICINPFKQIKISNLNHLESKKIYIKVPNIVKNEFNYIEKFIDKNLDKIEGIVTANLGIISKFKNKLNILGDYKLNITNSCALDFYSKIMNGTCLSVELSKHEINELIKNSNFKTQMFVYGKVELMVSGYCALGSTFGGKTTSKNCKGTCKEGEFFLIDRKKKQFPLNTDEFCRSYIYNSVATNLIPHIEELRNMGIDSFRVDFIDEDYSKTKKILECFEKEEFHGDFSEFTRGHYKNSIE